MERAAALRSLQLLVRSGGLEFQKGMAGMDSENNMSSHVANICSQNAHSPASNPRRLKALFPVVIEEHDQYIVTIFGNHNSVTKPFAFLHETGFLLQLQWIWEWCNSVELWSLEFQNETATMDSSDKHLVTCCEHLQLIGSQANPRRLQAESRQFFIDLQQSRI